MKLSVSVPFLTSFSFFLLPALVTCRPSMQNEGITLTSDEIPASLHNPAVANFISSIVKSPFDAESFRPEPQSEVSGNTDGPNPADTPKAAELRIPKCDTNIKSATVDDAWSLAYTPEMARVAEYFMSKISWNTNTCRGQRLGSAGLWICGSFGAPFFGAWLRQSLRMITDTCQWNGLAGGYVHIDFPEQGPRVWIRVILGPA